MLPCWALCFHQPSPVSHFWWPLTSKGKGQRVWQLMWHWRVLTFHWRGLVSRHAVLLSLKGLHDCMTAHDQPALSGKYEKAPPGTQVQLSSIRLEVKNWLWRVNKGLVFPSKLSSMAGALYPKRSIGSSKKAMSDTCFLRPLWSDGLVWSNPCMRQVTWHNSNVSTQRAVPVLEGMPCFLVGSWKWLSLFRINDPRK